MIKMIASDLDGTLLLDSRTVSEQNRLALARAAASGIEVVIASGRVLTSLPESVFQIPGIRYAVTSNGAAIYQIPAGSYASCTGNSQLEAHMNFQKSDKSQAMAINSNSGAHTDFQKSDKRQAMAINSNSGAHTDLQKSDKGPALAINSHTQARTDFQSILDRNPQNYSDSFRNRLLSAQRICHHPLPEEAVLDLLDLTSAYPSDRFPLSYEVFINGVAYACSSYINEPGRFGASPAYVNYVRTTRIMKDDIRGFICQHRSELDGLDLVVGDDTLCTQLRNRIRNTLPDIYTTSSVPNRIENSSPEAGKGAALRFLCSRLGIRTEDSIAFGDADNDIDLLTSAGIGIAMENGTERCREAADYVTGRHDRDGVAEALRTRFAI